MCFLIDVDGVRLLVSDRNAFIWAWRGHRMIGCVRVGDALFGVSSDAIRVEFMRILKSRFKPTRGDRLVTEYCGLEVDQDLAAQTIKLHQSDFRRRMLREYDPDDDLKLQKTPMRVKATALVP